MKNITKYGLGTFTYREKPRRSYTVVGVLTAYFTVLYLGFQIASPALKVANAYAPEQKHTTPNNKTVAKPTTQQQKIINDIYSVFGKVDGDKFLFILTHGKPNTACPRGENPTLDPYARNWNNDQYGSIDYGIGQINDHWQGVTNTDFLFDYDINIRLAHKIFEKWGNFQAWTCGKVWGL